MSTTNMLHTDSSPAPLVRLQNVSKDYVKGGHQVQVLRGIDLDIAAGEFVAVMGPSGTGKTTLLNLLGGLDYPDAGTVQVGGVAIDKLGARKVAAWRAGHVGFIFQFYNLIAVLNARQNVELPLTLTGLGAARRRELSLAALSLMGLGERSEHFPGEMSGGEQQRVAIARAIIASPQLLLCDEPTGDLDQASGTQILGLLHMLCKEYGKTIVMVTHDAKAAQYATRRIYLGNGSILESTESDHDVPTSLHLG